MSGARVVGIRKAAIATAGTRIAASSFGSPIPPESRLVSAYGLNCSDDEPPASPTTAVRKAPPR